MFSKSGVATSVGAIGYRALDRIGQTLAPVMLRRRKAEVLTQLPERVDKRIFVPLTPQQRMHHDENGEIVVRVVARWRKTGYLSDSDQRRLTCALQNMRMVCNSTFLLDHETDHGHKVDELMTLLDELLEDPAAKAVVFSQWLGTHELIERRLAMRAPTLATAPESAVADYAGAALDVSMPEATTLLPVPPCAGRLGAAGISPEGALAPRGGPSALTQQGRPWGHVLFSGSVPSDQRGALVARFHDDPNCRLFLSTDAGGVGLNLQHAAAVVVNMDMPWNPAVLEQRIGRVHRMGQSRGVQVVNFVGQGSIEEGMLSVLAFKKSLFAGVLDGGESEVFMQGTRLAKFMESVEQVAGAIGEADADAEPAAVTGAGQGAPGEAAPISRDAFPAGALDAPADQSEAAAPLAKITPPVAEMVGAAADPWAAILEAGAALLQGLAAARGTGGAGGTGNGMAPIKIEHDPVTGQASIRVPLPDPVVLQRLAKAFEPWLR